MSQRHGASEIWFVFPDAWPRAKQTGLRIPDSVWGFFCPSHSLFQLFPLPFSAPFHISPLLRPLPASVPTPSGENGSCAVPTWLVAERNFFQRQRDKKNQLASGQLCLYSAVMVISCFSLAILQAWAGLRSSVLSALLLPPARHTVWHAEPNSLIRDQAQTPCIGSMGS